MADDREILRELWEGRVPVCIQLASEDCNTLSAPDPYYLMVPRHSYFPLVMEKVRKHFSRSLSSSLQEADVWLEYDGVPLKWHYPVGVLFDLYSGGSAIPWNLTAHYSRFPEQDLIRCPSRDAVGSHFMSAVKEADGLKHRGQVITNMQSRDHKQLWLGLCNDKFDQFWTINRKLMECGVDEGFKNIPFRLHIPDSPPIQKLIKPVTDDGRRLTLADLLAEVISDKLIEGRAVTTSHGPHPIARWSPKGHGMQTARGEQRGATPRVKCIAGSRVVIQGIEPPQETPIQWLSEHLSHPDNFLHICCLPPQQA